MSLDWTILSSFFFNKKKRVFALSFLKMHVSDVHVLAGHIEQFTDSTFLIKIPLSLSLSLFSLSRARARVLSLSLVSLHTPQPDLRRSGQEKRR